MTHEAMKEAQKKWHASVVALLSANSRGADAAHAEQAALYVEYNKAFQEWCGMTLEEVEDLGDT
jgi:hypothetical protein